MRKPQRAPGSKTSAPFQWLGQKGMVEISYGVVRNPVEADFDVIPNLAFDMNSAIGYPVLSAKILDYDGGGARGLFGWIQIVTNERKDSSLCDSAQVSTHVSCDVLPSMMDLHSPFMSFGILPEVYDAPCRNLGNSGELKWYADTFLTSVPIRSRDEPIDRVAGFRWGYTEDASPRRQPIEILPLEVTNDSAWSTHLVFVQQSHPEWRFRDHRPEV